MKHQVEVIERFNITGRGTVFVVNQFPEDFTVGDLVNEEYIIVAIEGTRLLVHPPRYKNECGLVVKKI